LIATLFTWGMTALGAAFAFLVRKPSQRIQDSMLGFAAGVMIAASFWSLLNPAIELAEGGPFPAWIPAAAGFILGALFIWLMDKIVPHIHIGLPTEAAEGIRTNLDGTKLLILAVTLHNIPEGLAVGVAFGALATDAGPAAFMGAVTLALGIGIQNFPEGSVVSLPLRGAGLSRLKSFWFGQLSAIVEPIAAVIGAAAVMVMKPILPYALAFAAGAMIFVVVEEAIPESHQSGNADLATMSAMFGFVIMMILDVALG
jgi:ZIP family zinc transporter